MRVSTGDTVVHLVHASFLLCSVYRARCVESVRRNGYCLQGRLAVACDGDGDAMILHMLALHQTDGMVNCDEFCCVNGTVFR